MRLAIAQQCMHWGCDENVAVIVRMLETAAQAGATLCAFPELAITGFHRQIKSQAQPDLVRNALEIVAATCNQLHIAAAVGAPTFGADGRIFNSYLFIDATGKMIGSIAKTGLTPAEATFFARGESRPIFDFCGLRCSAVICREVEDIEQVYTDLPAGRVDLIFWPGMIRPAPDSNLEVAVTAQTQARDIARKTHAFVVQSNWPNSLNYPDESAFAGQSEVIDARGEKLLCLPRSQAGLAVFELGASDYDWCED
jgi:omega-amidase